MNGKKAKMLALCLVLISAHSALYADMRIPENTLEEKLDLHPHEDELIALDRVIILLGRQQEDQRKLKDLIVQLRHNKELFMKGDQSKIHAKLMLKAARESYAIIKRHHLENLFSSDFMEELALFSKVGSKPNE